MKQFNNNQIKKKIIEAKNKLKNLSLDYKKNFINIEKTIGLEVEEIEKCIAKKEDVIPEIEYNFLLSNSIEKNLIKLIKKRGCVIVRNVFDKEKVNIWNKELVKYIEQNNYYEDQKSKLGLDQYFNDLNRFNITKNKFYEISKSEFEN